MVARAFLHALAAAGDAAQSPMYLTTGGEALGRPTRSKQRRAGPPTHGTRWSEIEGDPRELLREAGVPDINSGARGGVGWRSAPAGAGDAGPACALVPPAREGVAAPPQEAGDHVAEAPAVAAARYYASFELAGEAIARRIGFDRVAAAEAAAAEAAADAALAGGGAAAGAAGGAAPAASAPAAARAVPVAAPAGGASADSAWRIFDLTVEAARRLPPTVLTSSCTDVTVPWYESAEMYWALRDCGVPAKHLVYNKVSHGDFVTQWSALPRISGQVAGGEADLAPHAADLVKVVSGRVGVRY